MPTDHHDGPCRCHCGRHDCIIHIRNVQLDAEMEIRAKIARAYVGHRGSGDWIKDIQDMERAVAYEIERQRDSRMEKRRV